MESRPSRTTSEIKAELQISQIEYSSFGEILFCPDVIHDRAAINAAEAQNASRSRKVSARI